MVYFFSFFISYFVKIRNGMILKLFPRKEIDFIVQRFYQLINLRKLIFYVVQKIKKKSFFLCSCTFCYKMELVLCSFWHRFFIHSSRSVGSLDTLGGPTILESIVKIGSIGHTSDLKLYDLTWIPL